MRRLVLLAGIWGWSFLFIKVAVEGMTPTTVAGTRVALGAVFLVGMLKARGVSLPRDTATWRHFAVVGLAGCALPFSMLAWGEQRITSALTSVLNASTPLFTAVIAAAMLRERLRPVQAGGLLVGLAGVMIAAGLGGADLASSSVAGSGAAVLAGACYGFTFTYARRNLMGVPPLVAATGQLICATAWLAPVALFTTLGEGLSLTPTRVTSIVLLGVVGSGIAYILSFGIIAELGPTRASLVTYLIPVVAVAVGVIVLGEPFHLRVVLGGLLIVGGIVLVNRRLRAPVPRFGTAASLVLVVTLAAGLAGCGEDASAAGCEAVRRESLDRNYLVHVLPNGPQPDYQTDPPTSGPHLPTPVPEGEQAEPIPRAAQVGILEAGGVLVQFDGLDPAVERRVRGLDREAMVVVAPFPDLPAGTSVVATAWRTKQVCSEPDVATLRRFVTEYRGQGPDGGHGT